jgi:Zn-dependent protease with chaperone function
LLLAIWCAALPGAAQAFGFTPQSDIKQGAEAAKLVEQEIGLYPAPLTEAYVRQLGQRLAATANDKRWDFRFNIVDQKEPNAFAIPGGGIYVSRGLLTLVNSEDELAGVLAHEIAHVTQRHSANRQRRGFLPGLLSLPGNLVGSVVSQISGHSLMLLLILSAGHGLAPIAVAKKARLTASAFAPLPQPATIPMPSGKSCSAWKRTCALKRTRNGGSASLTPIP